MDLKSVLNDQTSKKNDTIEPIRTHKKPMQLRDIENRSSSNKHQEHINTDKDIELLIEKEKKEIYKKKWNKLDLGLKLNRINQFTDTYDAVDNDGQKKQLNRILISACKSGKLNRNSDITYDIETCEIKEIKILKKTDDIFILDINDLKKKQSTGRSKSNIERLLKA